MILPFLLKKINTELGDVPILLGLHGQSNMVGNGTNINEVLSTYPSLIGLQERCYSYVHASNEFQQMNIGVNHGVDGIGGTLFGSEVRCITELSKLTTSNVHYVKYAVGGTHLPPFFTSIVWSTSKTGEHWDLYKERLDNAVALMNSTYGVGNWIFLGNCWHQGEADASDQQNNYEQEEIDLINAFRARYGANVVWISGGIRVGDPEQGETPLSDIVNQRKQANAAKSSLNYWFSNQDLTLFDTIHYDSLSQVTHGERYKNILASYI